MTLDPLRDQVRRYYEGKLREHGFTAQGVDWNSATSQELRFHQLVKMLDNDSRATVLDYGCGYGAFAMYLREHGYSGRYHGFDISDEMIAAATRVTVSLPDCGFTSSRAELEPADYTIASGIFSVKMASTDATWRDYVFCTIADMRALSRHGFAFNALTSYSDPEKRRADLYYANPFELFEHCRDTYSRYVSLLHDYELYEFTLLVRL